jgi:hypothetical protein
MNLFSLSKGGGPKLKTRALCFSVGLVFVSSFAAANLLQNGNLDVTHDVEIVPGFFLPQPSSWTAVGTRSISGPYNDELSSESWAGPAPTPVTTDGFNETQNNHTNDDWGVFFKPFSGNATDGLATGHLFQDVAGSAGTMYTLTGWAGAEANALMRDAVFALDFLNVGGGLISSSELSLMPTLFVNNGQPFNYKFYQLSALAPAGTAAVRARVSMLDAQGNPQGGGQAFVVDDFEMTSVPEPTTIAILGIGGLMALHRRRKA